MNINEINELGREQNLWLEIFRTVVAASTRSNSDLYINETNKVYDAMKKATIGSRHG